MVHRAVTLSQNVVGTFLNGCGYIVLGIADSGLNIIPVGQLGGYGRRERTAGAMVVDGVHLFSGILDQPVRCPQVQKIGAAVFCQMAAFNQH